MLLEIVDNFSSPLPPLMRQFGIVTSIVGQTARIDGLSGIAGTGARIVIHGDDESVAGEVIADEGDGLLATLYDSGRGLRSGLVAECVRKPHLSPCSNWLGHILDHNGLTADGFAPRQGQTPVVMNANPPAASHRRQLGPRLLTRYAAIDTFLPLCRGQRIGLFAGSGVGKTSLLGGLAKQADADINVIALIGERGREVRNFVETVIGEDAMKRTVVFAATSDQPPAIKLRTARLAMATAETFRDQGSHVMFLFDSLTRFAQAHREVALAAKETPALHAYPPSTFPALAKLCERAGPGDHRCKGDITAIFSVLVQGSDMEEPIADTVRGILDGHVVLDRAIAEGGRYPAIDIGRSVSRSLPEAATQDENGVISDGRAMIRKYEEGRLMVQSGLYTQGSDAVLDLAVACHPKIDGFLRISDSASFEDSFGALKAALAGVGQQ